MSGRGHQLIHSDALSAELEALGLDSSLFGAAGIPAPIFQALVPRRAGVFDEHANTFGTGDEPAAFTRASNGIYRDSAGNYQIAADGAIRAEYSAAGAFLGYLFEPASTNKCENYNANPDVALTGVSAGGGLKSRVLAVADLAAAGLSEICADGYVTELENNTGASIFPTISGTVGNLNDHTVSLWLNTFGVQCRVGIGSDRGIFTTSSLERVAHLATPDTTARTIQFHLTAGQVVQFALNQLEELAVPTSPIITDGSPETRAIDQLVWAVEPSGFAHTEGMAMAALSYPSGYQTQALARAVLSLRNASGPSLIHTQAGATQKWRTTDGTNVADVVPAGGNLGVNERATIVSRWGPLGLEIGCHHAAGGWNWSGVVPFDGAFLSDSRLQVLRSPRYPTHIADVRLWNRCLTTTQIQAMIGL